MQAAHAPLPLPHRFGAPPVLLPALEALLDHAEREANLSAVIHGLERHADFGHVFRLRKRQAHAVFLSRYWLKLAFVVDHDHQCPANLSFRQESPLCRHSGGVPRRPGSVGGLAPPLAGVAPCYPARHPQAAVWAAPPNQGFVHLRFHAVEASVAADFNHAPHRSDFWKSCFTFTARQVFDALAGILQISEIEVHQLGRVELDCLRVNRRLPEDSHVRQRPLDLPDLRVQAHGRVRCSSCRSVVHSVLPCSPRSRKAPCNPA